MRIKRVGVYVIVLLLSAGWIAYSHYRFPVRTADTVEAPKQGFAAPDFSLFDLAYKEFTLSEQTGKPVVVNFWASWCTPCIAEAEALQNVYEDYAQEGLVLLGVNMTQADSLNEVEKFVITHAITFPILLDSEGAVGRSYHVQALPTTFFISTDGRIQDIIIGGPMSEVLLRSKVVQLLTEKP